MANPRVQSPLRYPGGKACLTQYITELAQQNELVGGHYIELYAGGAGAALNLLYNNIFSKVHINDYDYSIYSFWHSILNNTEDFIKKIESTPITLNEWHKQKEIFDRGRNSEQINLGFATFFLNRTNRSGIIFKAGPIGGFEQTGNYLIDVRFNKKNLIERIEKIGNYADHIHLTNEDATEILQNIQHYTNDINSTFLYLDPPYYNKGKQLYLNNYGHDGHESLAQRIYHLPHHLRWLISYDNVEQIRKIYNEYRLAKFDLNYTLQSKKFGSELLIFSDNLNLGNEITVNGRTSDLSIFRHLEENEPANPIHIA